MGCFATHGIISREGVHCPFRIGIGRLKPWNPANICLIVKWKGAHGQSPFPPLGLPILGEQIRISPCLPFSCTQMASFGDCILTNGPDLVPDPHICIVFWIYIPVMSHRNILKRSVLLWLLWNSGKRGLQRNWHSCQGTKDRTVWCKLCFLVSSQLTKCFSSLERFRNERVHTSLTIDYLLKLRSCLDVFPNTNLIW